MYKMLAFTIKFWLVAIPFSVTFGMSFLITFLISNICFALSILFAFVMFIFLFFSFMHFMTYCSDIFWIDLYVWSVEKKLNIKIQKFLKFLKEN